MIRLKTLLLMTAVALPLSLSACGRYEDPFTLSSAKTVQTATYKAADLLAGQALGVVGRDTPIAVGTLSDINDMETSTALGRMISEQLGARFVQLGYNVSEIKLRNDINVQQVADGGVSAGEYVFTRDRAQLAGNTNARAVVSGTYAVAGDNIVVNVRMIDVNNSRVLAAHDYTVPMNADTRRLLQTKGDQTGIFSSGWAQ